MKSYCINLDERQDRWLECQQEFARIGLENVLRVPARVETTPLRDCAIDHASCLGTSIINHDDMCLIMEDDVQFKINDWSIVIETIDQLTNIDPTWDILYLGLNADPGELGRTGPPKRLTENIYRIFSGYATHAYVVRSSIYKEIIQLILRFQDSGLPHDLIYSKELLANVKAYCVNPLMALQRPSYSSILKRYVDYDFMVSRWLAAISINGSDDS